jgi:hypothetical protein
MLTRIGPARGTTDRQAPDAEGDPPAAEGDPVDLLLGCHARIRSFLTLAARLAGPAGAAAPVAEIADTAARIHRYFAEALPLHAQDEEESLAPRLRGLDPELDAAIAAMIAEHAGHAAPLGDLLGACAGLVADPARLATLAAPLAAAAAALEAAFAAHLAAEEGLVFPAIRSRLDDAARAAIVAEMRRRRTPA